LNKKISIRIIFVTDSVIFKKLKTLKRIKIKKVEIEKVERSEQKKTPTVACS